jgi:hypothetical protein
MPEQLLVALTLLIALLLFEYILAYIPGDPFKALSFNGNIVRLQKSVLSRQISIEKSQITKAVVSPGGLHLALDHSNTNSVVQLNFNSRYTDDLYSMLRRELSSSRIEYV